MNDWGWRFALVAMAFAWWALLTQPSENTEEMLDYERRFHETLLCERRYFDPSCVPYEPPTVIRVRVPEDFRRAWEHPRPTIITLDMWPACYDDGSLGSEN